MLHIKASYQSIEKLALGLIVAVFLVSLLSRAVGWNWLFRYSVSAGGRVFGIRQVAPGGSRLRHAVLECTGSAAS